MSNLVAVLNYIYGSEIDFGQDVFLDLGADDDLTRNMIWNLSGSAPTVAERQTVAATQEFADWLAEHGGDAVKTFRRQAREALADNAQASAAVDRAIVIELLTYCRHIAKKHNDLLAWLGTQTTLQNRAQLNGFVAVEPTNQEARDAIVGRINAGEADS